MSARVRDDRATTARPRGERTTRRRPREPPPPRRGGAVSRAVSPRGQRGEGSGIAPHTDRRKRIRKPIEWNEQMTVSRETLDKNQRAQNYRIFSQLTVAATADDKGRTIYCVQCAFCGDSVGISPTELWARVEAMESGMQIVTVAVAGAGAEHVNVCAFCSGQSVQYLIDKQWN